MPSCHIRGLYSGRTHIMHWQIFQLLNRMLGGLNLCTHTDSANRLELWPALLTQSSYSLVSSNLYWSLSRDETAWTKVPSEAQEYLSSIFELNTLRNQAIGSEASALITCLNAHNITPLMLKNTGELLSGRTPHIGYRMQTDIDLLVKPAQLQRAYSAIQAQGYQVAQEYLNDQGSFLKVAAASKKAALQREYFKHQHLPPLIKTGANASVELHRHAYARPYQQRFDLDTLFDEAEPQQTNDYQYLVMAPPQRRSHLVYHSYLNDGFRARYDLPLRAACDWLQQAPANDTNDVKIQFFEDLVKALLQDATPADSAVRRHLIWLKRRYNSGFWSKLLNANGKFRTGLIKVIYNPQRLCKRWRLIRK